MISEASLCYNDLQAGFSEEGKLNVVIADIFMDSGMSGSTQFIAAEFTTQLDQGISHTHTHAHAQAHAHLLACIYTHSHTFAHMHTHTHMHVHTCTHLHTY